MTKLNQILTTLLVIQLLIAGVVFFYQQSATADVASRPLFPSFETDEVVEVTISDGEGQIVLAKQDDQWVLPEADDFPVDGEKVTPLLADMKAIETNRLVTRTSASHSRLQVAPDDFNRLVVFELADGTTHELYIGSSAGAGANHVRAGNQDEVFLTGEVTPFEANAQATSWVDTLYFTVPQTVTTRITLANANGTFEFEQVDEETWQMADLAEDETLNQTSVKTLLNQVTSIRLNTPLGKTAEESYGLDDPQATVTIEADETYTLEIGASDPEDNTYVLKASNSPYYVRIAQFTGDNLVNKTQEDFLEAPPTEETEGELPGSLPAPPPLPQPE